ncbi:MAG TPA: hypothetical protein VFA12_06155 [Stellaceae bacterium]|nr:hypothetical protein [Stellaceae bacterium]
MKQIIARQPQTIFRRVQKFSRESNALFIADGAQPVYYFHLAQHSLFDLAHVFCYRRDNVFIGHH